MGIHTAARVTTPARRRWALWLGIPLLGVLLMGSAFVGGRLLAEQDLRNIRRALPAQMPAQLPKDTPAGSGTVQTIQGQVLTLGRMSFGAPGGPGGGGRSGGANASSQAEVVVNPDTKLYKSVQSTAVGGQGMPGGAPAQAQAEEAKLDDVKIGNMIMVWGPKSGERITAEVIYIQATGR